jgi:DNA repair protein RadA/Sms
MDVFVNVAGGVRLEEPATDLAVALALVSSLRDRPLPPQMAAFGEIGLAGEVRAVDRARARVVEASKFGFLQCMLPQGCMSDVEPGGVELIAVGNVAEAVAWAVEN